MDSTLKPILKRQIVLIGASLSVGFLVSYFFGFLLGLVANIGVLVGIMFYFRRRQLRAMRAFGFSDETAGGRRGDGGGEGLYTNERTNLRYVCLSCGAEFKGARCASCGSKMKKPLF